MNDRLEKWNKDLAEVRRHKLGALEFAMRHRGFRRSIGVLFYRFFAWAEGTGIEMRDEWLRGTDE